MSEQVVLYPRHHGVGKSVKLRPSNMQRLHGVSAEQMEFIRRQALSIFADCSNANLPFADCLTAILISGMDWGMNFQGGRGDDRCM